MYDEDDEDSPWYCPHGEQVEFSGGACYRCAQEDADDSDDWIGADWLV